LAESFRIVVNKMPRVIAEVEAATEQAVDEALKTGVDEAKLLLTPGHGVDTGEMEAGIASRKTEKTSGEIVNPSFYGRFVEFGTTFMSAIPHIRPAAHKMGEEFEKQMQDRLKRVG
jgi:HK97 gp10 family phage protein